MDGIEIVKSPYFMKSSPQVWFRPFWQSEQHAAGRIDEQDGVITCAKIFGKLCAWQQNKRKLMQKALLTNCKYSSALVTAQKTF